MSHSDLLISILSEPNVGAFVAMVKRWVGGIVGGVVWSGSGFMFVSATNLRFVFIKSGASFSIAKILYLLLCVTGTVVSLDFFNIKKVSSSTLFLSEEGKESQILPSLAS